MLDIYLSGVNNRISSVMKILAVITTIFMPLTFLTGFFGMNFKFLPGLESHSAPLIISLCMIGLIITMLIFFRRKNWL
jgi:magnesium transporter